MSNFKPKGRKSLPYELLQFGVHVVYSEGTRTEPQYIDSIKMSIASKYNCSQNDIKIINGNGEKSFNTLGLVRFGLKDVKRRIKENEVINHVWFFFDKDDFPKDKYDEACKIESMNDSDELNFEGFNYNKDDNITYHCCYSNEAFELWLLLYFEYMDSTLTRTDYINKINNELKLRKFSDKYSKNMENIHQTFTSLGGSIDKAINSAKKLTEENGVNCPSTAVWKFAEYFKPYLDNKK